MADPKYTAAREQISSGRQALARGNYARAFSALRSAAAIAPELMRQIDDAEGRYFYMLRYLTSGNNVDGIADTLTGVANDIKRLLRLVERRIIADTESTLYSGRLRFAAMRPEETLESLFSDYLARHDAIATDTLALTDVRRRAPLERLAQDIFYRLWIEYPFTADASALTLSIITDKTLPVHDRVMWIAALGLSLQGYADPDVVQLLMDIAADEDELISTAAVVWLMLAAGSSSLGPDIIKGVHSLHPDDVKDVVIEWLRSLGTNELAKKMADSISPSIARLGFDMQQKIFGKDAESLMQTLQNSDIPAEDLKTMRDIFEAQERGDDVLYGSAINAVAGEDFFRQLPNWFMTFHVNNSNLAEIVDGAGFAMGDFVSKMTHLCDVDKFAMLLQLRRLPQMMREDTLGNMAENINQLGDQGLDRMLADAQPQERKYIINRYIKNIFRFYNVFEGRREFANPLANSPAIDFSAGPIAYDTDTLAEIAHAYYIRKRYDGAAYIYRNLDLQTDLNTRQLLEYANALFILGRTEEFTAMAHSLEPLADADNEDAQRLLIEAYYMQGRYDDTLALLLSIDLKNSGRADLKGSIAWLMTIVGDYDGAETYYAEATDDDMTRFRHALLMWLDGRREQALGIMAQVGSAAAKLDAADKAALRYIEANAPMGPSLQLMEDILTYRRQGSPFGNL